MSVRASFRAAASCIASQSSLTQPASQAIYHIVTMSDGKCPNCGATISGQSPGACTYCGGAVASDAKRPRTRSEEISYEVNGLCFSTLVILVIAGIAWQIGWGKIAAVIAIVWFVVLSAYSWHLYRKFSKR